ncbi:MAG: GntR family transcriptional regulator [Steroidobacteraceae bacterium]
MSRTAAASPGVRSARPKRRAKAAALPNSTSLTNKAYAEMKERILTLYFQPGQFLNEGAICELLGIGRTPVHQALQRLQAEGLLEIVPRKGVIVQPDTVSQILDIIEARMIVEGELARRAAERATPADVAELKRAIETHDHEHGGGTIDDFVERDRAFHVKIASMSGIAALGDILKTLHERSTRFWYLHLWQTLDHAKARKEHRAVIDAVSRRDGAAASQAMWQHLEALRERLDHIRTNGPQRAIR